MREEEERQRGFAQYAALAADSVLAGVALGIACTANVAVQPTALGAFLFSVGMFTIASCDLALFTGKLCFLPERRGARLPGLLLCWTGNLLGAFAVGFALRLTRLAPVIVPQAELLCRQRLDDKGISIFLLGVFCNFLICMGVQNYRHKTDVLGRYVGLFLSVTVFVSCGYEQSVADMYYFSLASLWGMDALRVVLLASLGNLAGGLLMPAAAAWKRRLMQKPRRAAASEGAPAQRPGPPGPTIERERAFTSKREE